MRRVGLQPVLKSRDFGLRSRLHHKRMPSRGLVANSFLAPAFRGRHHQRRSISRRSSASALAICFFTPFTLIPTSLAISRSEEHTSELQSLMRISYAVFCLQHK